MTCRGCGASTNPSDPVPNCCDQCPPSTCAECGGINHIATDRMCACWVPLDGMSLADLKAVFAADGLNVTREA